MLLKSVDIQVYKLDDDGTFEPIGEIDMYTSLMWPDKYNGYTTFELNAPVNQKNSSLIKKGHIVWTGGKNACLIEIIQSERNEEGRKTYKVKGRTLEVLLTTRILWNPCNCVNKHSSTIMYEIVDKNCVNPSDQNRKIPFLECANDEQLGKIISFQKTGGEVYDAIESIATDADLGFDVIFNPREKKLIFKVIEGVDRATLPASGDASNLVIFSTDLEDILSSAYYTNDQDVKTLAFVAGEGEGVERKHVVSGDSESKGLMRRELYVDARDLQTETFADDGTAITIDDDDYRNMLSDRGNEKLAEHTVTDSFEVKMRVVGNIQYKYGVDYDKGDKVMVQDTDLGVQVIGNVTEVSENYDDEYELIITFGYSYPTLIQKVKRQISK